MLSTLPFPLADITRAARPREQRHYTDARPLPHTTLPELGVVPAARRRFSLFLVPDGSPLRASRLPSPLDSRLQRISRSHAHGHALKDNV